MEKKFELIVSYFETYKFANAFKFSKIDLREFLKREGIFEQSEMNEIFNLALNKDLFSDSVFLTDFKVDILRKGLENFQKKPEESIKRNNVELMKPIELIDLFSENLNFKIKEREADSKKNEEINENHNNNWEVKDLLEEIQIFKNEEIDFEDEISEFENGTALSEKEGKNFESNEESTFLNNFKNEKKFELESFFKGKITINNLKIIIKNNFNNYLKTLINKNKETFDKNKVNFKIEQNLISEEKVNSDLQNSVLSESLIVTKKSNHFSKNLFELEIEESIFDLKKNDSFTKRKVYKIKSNNANFFLKVKENKKYSISLFLRDEIYFIENMEQLQNLIFNRLYRFFDIVNLNEILYLLKDNYNIINETTNLENIKYLLEKKISNLRLSITNFPLYFGNHSVNENLEFILIDKDEEFYWPSWVVKQREYWKKASGGAWNW